LSALSRASVAKGSICAYVGDAFLGSGYPRETARVFFAYQATPFHFVATGYTQLIENSLATRAFSAPVTKGVWVTGRVGAVIYRAFEIAASIP
jgi:hypothetical protein